MPTWISRLDARDRALFTRWAILPGNASSRERAWQLITHAGGARASIGVCLASVLIPAVTWQLAWRVLLLLGVSHLAVQIIKRAAGRPRPSSRLAHTALIDVPDRFSFPSGHACAAMAVAVGFAWAFPALSIPLLLIAGVVGFSRVALGVHYPGDVLVGQLIALVTAYPILA